MKVYIKKIHSPLDMHEYKFTELLIPKESDLFTESEGGSNEDITIEYENGILLISTPCFVINPRHINIGYEIKSI